MSNFESIKTKVEAWASARKTELYLVCVDDEPEILDLLSNTLSASGFKIQKFTDPKAALDWIKTNSWRVALVISDIKMPVLDGFALAQQVPPGTPFAILSGHVDREMAMKGVELKVAAFLSKPAPEEELIALIEKEALPRASSINDELELLQGFAEDAKGLLEQIEPLVLGFEESPTDREALNSLYGMVHTIKGASGFFEPKTMHNFVHKFEDKLKQLQASNAPVSSASVGMMLKATDIVRKLLDELEQHNYQTTDITPLLSCLEVQDTPSSTVEEGEAGPAKERAQKSNELKVDVSLLDRFIQASGEMTVVRNMITKSVQAIEKSYKSDRDVQMLSELLEEFHKINASVQTQIADLRKVPVKSVLKSLPRIVRDLSKSLGKQVNYSTEGDDLRVDTAVIEALSKSLVHLVRNSLDHGLETPEQRGDKGPAGNILIRSFLKDEHVYVEVSDDGRGINTAKVREKALGIYPREQVLAMSNEQIHLLIFESGFSTAEKVTDVSGRGVGMSVVKESVEALGGEIQIATESGKGTTFRLVIPVPKSVLIKNCLFLRAAGQEFGIPHDQIVRVIRDPKLERLEGRQVFRVGEELLEIASLSRLFHSSAEAEESTYVVVRGGSGGCYALPISEVHDFEDTVIKPLEPFVRRAGIFLGATFLGDGSVGLVLDIDGVARTAGINGEAVSLVKPVAARSDGTDYLLFELSEQLCAIPANTLSRIEELDLKDALPQKNCRKIPYRGGILPVVEVAKALGSPEHRGDTSKSHVLVVQVEDRTYGMQISRVREFIRCESALIPLPKPEPGVLGSLVHLGKTVTVVDPGKLTPF